MKKQAWIPVLFALFSLSFSFNGCSQISSTSSVQSPPKVPPQATAIGADLQNKIRKSQLKFQLKGPNGTKGTLYMFAEDENVQPATDSSCYAVKGDAVRSGDYDLYLEQDDNSVLEKQDVPLFPDATLEFDDNHPQYQLYADPQKQMPDLLMLKQTVACSGSEIALFMLSPDGKRVQQLDFLRSGTSKSTIVAKTFDRVAPDRFQTSFYNNAKETYQTIIWQWLPDQQTMVEQTETTTQKN